MPFPRLPKTHWYVRVQVQGTNATLFEAQEAFSTMDEDGACTSWSYIHSEVDRMYIKVGSI